LKSFADFGIDVPAGRSGEHQTTCPKCSAGRKKKLDRCLSVNIEKRTWICHHCDWRGGLPNGNGNGSRPEPARAKARAGIKYPWPQSLPEKVKNYLVGERRIPEEVLTRNKIGFGKIWMPQVEGEVDTIQFPYLKSGEVVNVKSRDGEKHFRQVSGAEKILFGYDDISDESTIIVEGEIDKLSLEVAGFQNTVSVPDGAPPAESKNYSSKFDFLENCKDRLEPVKKFIIAVDNDGPGKKLEDELARRLGRERCSIVTWQQGCKDANEVLVKHGAERLKQCIENAQPCPVEGLFSVGDISERILDLYDRGLQGGADVGWLALGKFYSVRPGEFTVVTGIPSHGKSELIDAMLINLAESEGWHFGICSPENYPLERHAAKLIEKRARKPFRRGPTERLTSAELLKTSGWLDEHFTFLMPDENELTVDGILSLAKALVYRKGIKGLVIDPWNELDHSRPASLSETEYISQSLTRIRRFARTHGVHVWLIAHPTKLYKDNSGKYPVPSPYDISGSAHWRNKADNCLTIWRDLSTHTREVQVHAQKIRFKEVGSIGLARLNYDFLTGRYSDAN